jgi:hypothetical protein
MAAAHMLASGTAIRELPIAERRPPQTGQIAGRAVAKDETHIAVAITANRFVVVEATSLRDVQIGERLSLRFHQGRASIDDGRDRGR